VKQSECIFFHHGSILWFSIAGRLLTAFCLQLLEERSRQRIIRQFIRTLLLDGFLEKSAKVLCPFLYPGMIGFQL